MFRDGSADPITDNTGSAVAVPGHRDAICKQTLNFLRVYTDKLYTISMALEWVEQAKPNRAPIRSDSASAMYSLKLHPVITKTYYLN